MEKKNTVCKLLMLLAAGINYSFNAETKNYFREKTTTTAPL